MSKTKSDFEKVRKFSLVGGLDS